VNIYTAEQIRAWDAYTIQHEPIESVDLMERAAQQCVNWLVKQPFKNSFFKIFCGKGNNGGDGLAIARMLVNQGIQAAVYILEFGHRGTEDFQINLQRLHELPVDIHFLQKAEHFPPIQKTDVIIDALYGSGLNKPLQDLNAALVHYINQANNIVISIDVPSGLYIDRSSKNDLVIHATYTLTFQSYKLALLVAENAPFIGDVQVLDIGLHSGFLETQSSPYQLIDETMIKNIFRPRQRFAHKGTYGHALLVSGSYGKIGAAVLAAKACLRSGAGLTTAYLPRRGYAVMQTALPEVMTLCDVNENYLASMMADPEKYAAIGIGPGIGTAEDTQTLIQHLLQACHKPVVMDADALNCIALKKEAFGQLPSHTVLTPHPKEFERLFGTSENDFDRMALARQKAGGHTVIIVLKGHHTLIALPDGSVYFNNTGNAGMARGGSGDVLTGIITALLAQGYPPKEAALLGVFTHGLAGDLAAETFSKEAMTATDIITFLSQAFLKLNAWKKADSSPLSA
jgi:NAD(P)H-hydrate epimerase